MEKEIAKDEVYTSLKKQIQILNTISCSLASDLSLEQLVQAITDACTQLSEAQFGSFFYNVLNDKGESYTLYTISGVPKEHFTKFPMPRNTAVFAPTFYGQGVIRSADITKDPRYGKNEPHKGMPKGHLPVRSYLALPVVSKTGEVLGGLFFGHSESDKFTAEHEALVLGVAAQATVAIELDRLRKDQESSLSRLRMVLETIPQMAWTAKPNGEVDYYNKRWYDYIGLPPEQVLGTGWTTVLHPDDMARVSAHWINSISTGELFVQETRFLRHSDQQYRWHLSRASAIFNQDNKIVMWVGTTTDMHDMKITLERLSQAQKELSVSNLNLVQKNSELERKNSDLDNFIYTASHDLKSPISNIEGLLVLLKDALPDKIHLKDDVHEILSLMDSAIKRFQRTILDLTNISKTQKNLEDDIENVEFRQILDDVQIALHELISQNNAFIQADFSDCPSIRFSRKNLRSIMYNLVSNAIKYRTPQKTPIVKITTSCENDRLELVVSDNGLGIQAEDRDKIFTMFKRLHTHIDGSGVGLYLVKRIVDNAGGKIEVEGAPGEGSVFKIYIPLQSSSEKNSKSQTYSVYS